MRAERTFYMRYSLQLKRRKRKPKDWGEDGGGLHCGYVCPIYHAELFPFFVSEVKTRRRGESIKKFTKNMILSCDSRPLAFLILCVREVRTSLRRMSPVELQEKISSSYRKEISNWRYRTEYLFFCPSM
jgi:hypothetical protein